MAEEKSKDDSKKELAMKYKEEGNKRMGNRDWKGAANSYTKAIQADPSNHIFYSNRSAAYIRLSEPKNALKDAEECKKLAPEWPKSYVRSAHAFNELGEYDKAIEDCKTGLKYDQANASLLAMRKEAKNRKLLKKLLGHWHGSVPREIGKMLRAG